ncbi:MAG: molybdopterin-dependent oxidoreductase [Desulfovibrio sp.]|jgi:aldehyde oxidoreductase|nr:molybdopterin-dependent oxidoreductase [Desulfovibrio sp.]
MNTTKLALVVNGVEKNVLCDPDNDSLADVLRRMGLTGTKVGCGAGQCGSCTVLLDGKPVRSCVRKMRSVPEHARVETIEGIGTSAHPHPLQQAFITYAAVQCGFCSPGFIMSAKALLSENSNPTRQQVREWFRKHNNLCRCTGYIPIVDAVMEAAAVLRGEKTMQDIAFAVPEDGRIYGTNYPKPTALAKVLGAADFGPDVAMKMPEGSYHLAVVMAKRHHARIKRLDCSRAEAMPGVVKVITAKDVRGTNRITNGIAGVRVYGNCDERPIIAEDIVHRYGDVVAVVAAHSREQARAAAAVVEVDWEDLPAYLNYLDVVKPDTPPLHKDHPNLYMEQPLFKGKDPREEFKKAKYMVQGSFYTTRQPHLALEPDAAQAYPQDGGVVILCKSQYLYGPKGDLAKGIGLPREKIRIIQNAVGASFGYSMSSCTYGLAAVSALALNAPVSLVFDWTENQHFIGKRSATHANIRMACDERGKITAMDFHVGVDHGAYSDRASGLIAKMVRFYGYPYSVPNLWGLAQIVFSNHNFGIAFRSYGSPQIYTASEQIMDMMAEKIGMDPFEFRYLNIARPGDLSPTGVPYREYPMESMMDVMRPYYEKAKARAAKESTAEKKRGVGLSWGGYHVGRASDHCEIDLELNEDGSVTIYNTWADMGQGSDIGTLVNVHEALRPLGLKPEQIKLVVNDTGVCPDHGSTAGSRSHNSEGMAILNGAEQLMNAMRKPDGSWRSCAEMKAEGIPVKYRGVFDVKYTGIDKNTGLGEGNVGQNYVLTLSEVEVEVKTGKTRVLAATVVSDAGKVGSLQGYKGQLWSGYSHGVGFALSEDYSDMQKHGTLLGAGIPKCTDIPDDFTIIPHETHREIGPFGSTGCSEGFQSAPHVSILNALYDAVGVRIFELPATPEKVRALMERGADGKTAPEPYNLGCDMYERLAYIKDHPM